MMIFTGKMAGITIHGTDARVVPDRMCSSNYSFNMGKTGCPLSDRSTGECDRHRRFVAGCCVFWDGFCPSQLSIDGNQVTVRSAEYGISFDRKR